MDENELQNLKYKLGKLGFLLRGFPRDDLWWLHNAGSKRLLSPKTGLSLEALKLWVQESVLKL
jgi:hypothetical protein